jgi:hypothetical protein
MKTIFHTIPQMCIEAFADRNHLAMEINERKVSEGDPGRYYAQFLSTEVKEGGCLLGVFGNGPTPEDAIKDYARRISLRTLVWHANQKDRIEIDVPRLTNL